MSSTLSDRLHIRYDVSVADNVADMHNCCTIFSMLTQSVWDVKYQKRNIYSPSNVYFQKL